MEKLSSHHGQTPWKGLKPTPPAEFAQWPFYYASLQCNWVYWYTDVDVARAYVEDSDGKPTGLRVARFPVREGKKTVDKAVVLLNFQRYTAHYSNALGTTNEVEFNVVAYPANRAPGVPYMPLADFLNGKDQTKTLGHLRLHVAADNAIAVKAGRAVFGEPKFLGQFVYDTPTLNAAPSRNWKVKLIDPEDKDAFVYDMNADFGGLEFWPANCTPIPEFALGLGRTVMTRWTIMGQFKTAMLDGKDDHKRVKLKIGANDFVMTKDMRALIGEKNRAVAGQSFTSLPACAEPEGFYVDADVRDESYG
ncbi:acetoacetate decarboxylase family protein [Pikeienuella piscinae]|uniref:Acetoacetate decarboxylase family protein n=1 Tax=Pikeienuella piscinae TaxID=2748098 RepID=A0A7L5BVC9_9RHOB|nr:acetoacetate decarboxylase family protein [Pikeienuella piscinae]QIE56310.1 acetoacetate decarboxylase family protein [Pikeienuella piscinae]